MTRVVLTLAAPRIERIAQALRARGHAVLPIPFYRLVPLDDSSDPAALADAVARSDFVIPVSPSAVQWLLGRLAAGWPGQGTPLLIGPGSLQAWREAASPEVAARARPIATEGASPDGAALLASAALQSCAGRRILIVRGDEGREGWIDALRSKGAEVRIWVAYRREACAPDEAAARTLLGWLEPEGGIRWHFASTAAVERCDRWLSAQGEADEGTGGGASGLAWPRDPREAIAYAIHPRIAQALSAHGWRDVRLLMPGLDGLVAALECAP